MRRRFFALLVLAIPMAASAQTQSGARPKPGKLPNDSMQLGRKYTQWLYTSMTDSLIAHGDSASRAIDTKAAKQDYEQLSLQIASRAGTETKVLEERFITRNNMRQYWRTAEFDGMKEPLLIRLVINEKGELVGRGVGPASQAPPIDP